MYQSRAWWLSRLGCGFRTAIACTIVASATLYGPTKIHRYPTYPAFAYLTVILVVPECTLGNSLRSFWHVLYATIQVFPVAILSLWLMKPGHISYRGAALAIGVVSFFVGLPKSSTLLTKRIAFGNIVIVYAGAVIHGKSTGVVMHPVHVAASAMLGAVASVLALLLPFPRLAYSEVRTECRLYAENASKRLALLVKAFSAQSQQAASDLLLQTNSVAKAGGKLLRSIKSKQDGMVWERRMVRLMKPCAAKPSDRLQNLEIPLRGMEMAMEWPLCPDTMSQSFTDTVMIMEGQIGLKLEQVKYLMPFDATLAPETEDESTSGQLPNLTTASPTVKDLPAIFFLFCMRLLHNDFPVCPNLKESKEDDQNQGSKPDELIQTKNRVLKRLSHLLLSTAGDLDLVFALKCSLSLGLAVYLGLNYGKVNAYWSGLTIAISVVTGRQPAFNVANSRAHGTAMGSVYGVLGCFILKGHKDYRFILLLPWIFTISFLRRSRMFGEAWGISAAIGALLIMGRNNYSQPPNLFAITRIAEAVIGLSCFLLVELLLQPKRAFTLAKIEVSECLQSVRESIREIKVHPGEKHLPNFSSLALRKQQKTLKFHVEELERFIEEADIEPNFWFLPFNSSIYRKLQESLSKTLDLLNFIACVFEYLAEISQRSDASSLNDLHLHMDECIKVFGEKHCSSLKGLEDVMSIKSLAALERALIGKETQTDPELGKSVMENEFRLLSDGKEQIGLVVDSLVQGSLEKSRTLFTGDGDLQQQSETVLCVGALGFCVSSLMHEAIVMETEIKELIRRENSTEHVDMYAISGKVNCLRESHKVTSISARDFVASISIERPFLAT